MRVRLTLLILLPAMILSGCLGIPEDLEAVTGFEVNRYLGTWYEIARLDHSFERGLIKVKAEYSLREDGGIKVVNVGYDPRKNRWKESVGKAYFIGNVEEGRLKVSFFGPFYGAYNIISLDKQDYSSALVCGPNRSYLWILSRSPNMPDSKTKELIRLAEQYGFPTDELIFVEQ